MKINIEKIVEFFDSKSNGGNATSIVGILGEDLNAWAFKNYLEKNIGGQIKILDIPITTGHQKGKRLDRWIYQEKGSLKKLYQCEIKNWSASAIEGKPLAINASKEEIIKITKHYWEHQLKAFSDKEFPNYVSKVLVPMKKPESYENVIVEPVIIYWMPISDNTKKIKPFFYVSVSDLHNKNIKTPFKRFSVFSVSLYLRELLNNGINIVDMDMPHVEKRMKILESFIS